LLSVPKSEIDKRRAEGDKKKAAKKRGDWIMGLDKDTFRTFNNYLSKVAILLAPGMVILEFVFHRGFLSGNIHEIPELILLLIWSIFLSVPYYMMTTLTLLWLHLSSEKINTIEDPHENDDIYEESLPFTLFLVLITFVAYKILLWLNWPSFSTYLGIKREYVFCFVSIGLTLLISVPFAMVYYSVLDKVIDWIAWHKETREAKKKRGR
jgi:hypothetical protein